MAIVAVSFAAAAGVAWAAAELGRPEEPAPVRPIVIRDPDDASPRRPAGGTGGPGQESGGGTGGSGASPGGGAELAPAPPPPPAGDDDDGGDYDDGGDDDRGDD
jgi:uncharacterized membrane protein YgcG